MRARLIPRSTAGQLAAIVVLATVGAHMVALMIWIGTRNPTPPVIRNVSMRITMLVRACTALPPDACETALAAVSTPNFATAWASALPQSEGQPDPSVASLAGDVAAAVAPTPTHVAATPAGSVVSVAVGDHYAQFRVPPKLLQRREPSPLKRVLVLLVVTALPVLVLTLWGVRQVTRPLAALAQAAGSIDGDGAAPALPEQGTHEVRKLARAFNGLLDRLHRFVTERTRTLAAISHDLRTPLTRMRLRIEGVEDEALRDRLLKDVRMMELMIGSSLSLLESQEKREPEESVDLGVLLQTICDEFADAGNDVTYAGPLRCPALCRPRALERAVNNVIDNAIKFGGAARVNLHAETTALEIDIEDDGPGIPDALKDDVLKPFYRGRTVRGEGGGSGLGLAIAQTIVAGHGGALALQDREPHGLRVRLKLPRVRA
ncbi:MAG TPA: ATP-binding protein [Acidisphaera sp.]|nr:ATP-binding protein [Acidisphaera sp.]